MSIAPIAAKIRFGLHAARAGGSTPLYDFADLTRLMGFEDVWAFEKRYAKAVIGKATPGNGITEMDALVAYLQMLGTLVRFGDLPPERLRQ